MLVYRFGRLLRSSHSLRLSVRDDIRNDRTAVADHSDNGAPVSRTFRYFLHSISRDDIKIDYDLQLTAGYAVYSVIPMRLDSGNC